MPIVLERAIRENKDKKGVSLRKLAAAAGLGVSTTHRLLHQDWKPQKNWPEAKAKIEAFLKKEGIETKNIWAWEGPRPGKPEKEENPVYPPVIPPAVLEHFGFLFDPFNDEIGKGEDVFLTRELKSLESALFHAAVNRKFVALIGPVGSGKTTIWNRLLEKIEEENSKKDIRSLYICQPMSIFNKRLTGPQIANALLVQLGHEKNTSTEINLRSQKMKILLEDFHRNGKKALLVIDNAHDLHPSTIRSLKLFYDLTLGYHRLLGILLIGQDKEMLDHLDRVDLTEVRQRLGILKLKGVDGHVPDYIEFKVAKAQLHEAGRPGKPIFEPKALKAIAAKTDTPLLANVLAARSLIKAWETGSNLVTAEIVHESCS